MAPDSERLASLQRVNLLWDSFWRDACLEADPEVVTESALLNLGVKLKEDRVWLDEAMQRVASVFRRVYRNQLGKESTRAWKVNHQEREWNPRKAG